VQRLTLKQTSEYLNIPENTLRWWRTINEGPRSYALGRKVFYDRVDLDQWTDSQKMATARGGVR
jgi:hypothetical protein